MQEETCKLCGKGTVSFTHKKKPSPRPGYECHGYECSFCGGHLFDYVIQNVQELTDNDLRYEIDSTLQEREKPEGEHHAAALDSLLQNLLEELTRRTSQ